MSWFRKMTAAGLVLASSSIAAGCADNESMMFIIGVADITGSDCVLAPSSDGPFIGLGTLDVAIRDTYIAALVVGNQLTERGSRNQLRTETSRVRLEGAEVTLEDAGGAQLAEFTSLGSGFVHPAAGTDPSYGGFFTNLVPPGANLPEGQYVASIRVFGTTLGGQEIESGELRFPIDICNGCLVYYPGEALDASVAGGDPYLCATSPATAVDPEGAGAGTCNAGQDQMVSCVTCAASSPVCRDPALNPYYGG
ncbi:MAG TPA: hypothetical protein VM686_26935 [Polyangiaceae bacterium]|nr:hypothetical protein [Polyangiaceae bacterium]